MNLKSLDIVYIVKNTKYNGELRYSIRSVCQNFPFRHLWIVGNLPEGIKCDYHIPVKQDPKKTKYENVHDLLEVIANNTYISKNFVLFNDDFFVLKPVKHLPIYVNGTLPELIEYVKRNAGVVNSRYIEKINCTIEDLTKRDLPCNNFELHIPIIFNKKVFKDLMKNNGKCGRSLYCNQLYDVEKCVSTRDVKIYSMNQVPSKDQTFVSTTDGSFNIGEVGKYLRGKFNEPCKYEYE